MLLSSGSAGCLLADGELVLVTQPPVQPPLDEQELVGGVAEVDITPPPGLPTYGYSSNGEGEAKGYWLRLKGRIIVLQQGQTRIVLIQSDLGAASAMVHRRLAARLACHHVSPANLLLTATHTHGGPGGFFGDKFYNRAVAAKAAYIAPYADFLVEQLAVGVETALSSAAPGKMRRARIGFASALVDASATHNRSIEAWRRNYIDQGLVHDDRQAVERTLHVLRVDLEDPDPSRGYRPAGLWSVFAVHGTGMPAGYPLYHGDVHGFASRLVASSIRKAYPQTSFVAAMATGAEGDVSPGMPNEAQGKALTARAGIAEANAALRAFQQIGGPAAPFLREPRLEHAYIEVSMRGASTSRGRLCDDAELGGPQAAGSEASRGPVTGFLEIVEGAVGNPRGCQARKLKVGGDLQDIFFDPGEYPDVVPFQLLSFGTAENPSQFVLAGFPGEPTTELGRAVARAVAAKIAAKGPFDENDRPQFSPPMVAVLGLANGYATYFTTPSEYMAQHYEGGATLYGPSQGVFAVEQLAKLANSLPGPVQGANQRPFNAYAASRSFQPGSADNDLWPKAPCQPTHWKAGALDKTENAIVFHWTGMVEGENCNLPSVSVECPPSPMRPGKQSAPFEDARGLPASDEGIDFEVSRQGADQWQAAWVVRERPQGPCFVVVRHPGRAEPLVSAPFSNSGSP